MRIAFEKQKYYFISKMEQVLYQNLPNKVLLRKCISVSMALFSSNECNALDY